MKPWALRDNGPERVKDMTGKRAGMLTIGTAAPSIESHIRWHCKCDCGREVIVRGDTLRRAIKTNAASSCGCHKNKWKRKPQAGAEA